ncbi:hypothetical protein NX059_001912 [Plenodomus lindquistii]|nr:hypothetical protein NX059_001912 [Plenodomus lindquistii]
MTENITLENWQHYSTSAAKRKRADMVCFACHAKKVKCDLQQQKNDGRHACKNCFSVGRECQVRPSKRDKRRKSSKADETGVHFEHGSRPDGVDALLAADATIQAYAGDQTSVESNAVVSPQRSRHSVSSLRGGFRTIVSPRDVFASGLGANESPVTQREPLGTSLAETTPTQNGDLDSGFLQVYAQENQFDAENQAMVAQLEHRYTSELRPDLEQIFTDTYFEYCYPWCPVLDRDSLASDVARSPLLANSLALASSHIQPPLLPHDGPEAYYKRARTIFYDDEEADELMSLKALCLFYWWAPQSTSRVHRHSSWWWTSVIIRHAQQMNVHREPSVDDPNRDRLQLGLRRRIWWTAFARERLTSLCQSKPAIIDPDDCNIQEPTLADFPPACQHQGEIFIYWVRLCAIIGRIAKYLLKSNANSTALQNSLREELVGWIHSLPQRLRLPIDTARTENFDRDVHQLHLFYLTTIIILHLKRSGGQLPQALPPAIIAASCTARILKDILARGNSRFLMAITCWHAGTAFIALLQARRIPHLSRSANEDLDILVIAVRELQKMWASANVIAQGFERLRKTQPANSLESNHFNSAGGHDVMNADFAQSSSLDALANGTNTNLDDGFDWMRFFPFVSKSTGGIAESLLSGRELGTATRGFPSPNNELFHGTLLAEYQDLFDPFTDYSLGFSDMLFGVSQA